MDFVDFFVKHKLNIQHFSYKSSPKALFTIHKRVATLEPLAHKIVVFIWFDFNWQYPIENRCHRLEPFILAKSLLKAVFWVSCSKSGGLQKWHCIGVIAGEGICPDLTLNFDFQEKSFNYVIHLWKLYRFRFLVRSSSWLHWRIGSGDKGFIFFGPRWEKSDGLG